MKTQNFSRRDFLKTTSFAAGTFALGFYLTDNANAEIVKTTTSGNYGVELNSWLYIDTNGKVTLVSHRSEMGQGAYTAIPQIIAEELEVNVNEVNIIFAQGNEKKYGNQVTGGSSTVRGSYKNLLKLSATAREMLIQAAAQSWNVSKIDCYAKDGNVFHKPTGKKGHFGEFAVAASKLETPKEVKLKEISEYKIIRKPITRLDAAMKSNGQAIFGIDLRIPGMLYAVVERNPRFHGKVKSINDAETLKVPGVKKVFKVKMDVHKTVREGVAVVATSTWAAMEGKKALKVEWDDTGFEHVNTEDIYKKMLDVLGKEEGMSSKKEGDAASIITKAEKKLDVIYQTPYQAHSCMEPLNCVAHYLENKIEIWGPIQAPDRVQKAIAEKMNVALEKVFVNMSFLGGGFGRKAFMDYPHEAVLISKEMNAPVQVIWSREDDMVQGPYRPGLSYRCEGVVENGQIAALRVKNAGQDIFQQMGGGKKNSANIHTAEGVLKSYMETIKNISINDVPFETPIPVLWWRSVYSSTNAFAYESFMDELAENAGKDPIEFRKSHIKNERALKVLDKVSEMSNWKNRKKNEGFGIAISECFESIVAQVVKISKKADGGVKIDKVWAAFDCGWYVNPDTINAQVEGSVVMGLAAATIHEITFKDGLTEQQNFHHYPQARLADAPKVEVHIMDNKFDAGGVGEPGLPPLAPALTNAIFDLTGKRIRKLPFNMNEV